MKILVLHDSYSLKTIPHLARSFRESRFYWARQMRKEMLALLMILAMIVCLPVCIIYALISSSIFISFCGYVSVIVILLFIGVCVGEDLR